MYIFLIITVTVSHFLDLEVNGSVRKALPSIDNFRTKLAASPDGLSHEFLESAQSVINDFLNVDTENLRSVLSQCDSDIVEGFVTRFQLFSDEAIEMRVHVFNQGAEETFVHDHQFSFISYCLRGGYSHRIHNFYAKENSKVYRFTRQKGGKYSDSPDVIDDKELSVILVQPFSEGQMLFLSNEGYHSLTLDRNSKGEVITIIFRAVKIREAPTSVFEFVPTLSEQVRKQKSTPILPDQRNLGIEILLGAISDSRKKFDGKVHVPSIPALSLTAAEIVLSFHLSHHFLFINILTLYHPNFLSF